MDSYREQLDRSGIFRKYPFVLHKEMDGQNIFVNRLVGERNLFLSDIDGLQGDNIACLYIFASSFERQGLLDTIAMWQLQSCPYHRCVIVTEGCDDKIIKQFARDSVPGQVEVTQDIYKHIRGENESIFSLFALPGDVLHPSLIATLKRLELDDTPDIVVWNLETVTDDYNHPVEFLRRPDYEKYTLPHIDYIGTTFAIRNSRLIENLSEKVSFFDEHAMYLLQLQLALDKSVKWRTYPEYFTLRPEKNFRSLSSNVVGSYNAELESLLRQLFDGFSFSIRGTSNIHVSLHPSKKARGISVIIPFKDKPEITCKSLGRVLKQRFTPDLEVLLVNNNSSPSSLMELKNFISSHQGQCQGGKVDIQILDYSFPFNHSRQCNIAVMRAKHEVLIFLNNDAYLCSDNIIEELSAWALLDDVGIVGCRIVDAEGQLVSAGMKLEIKHGHDFSSAIKESTDETFSKVARETIGNTFACAAIERSLFMKMGPLDEIDFPNGYNDAEYNLRLRSRGYRNIYLGYLEVEHTPGTSRESVEEFYQKIRLREKYPEIWTQASKQLENDRFLVKQWGKRNRISFFTGKLVKSLWR